VSLTASKVFEELLDHLHVAGYLLATHLLDAVIAVVDTENLLAAENSHADDEDVLADEHVASMELASHGELSPAHVRHEKDS
jgi:phosphatidylglycerophosphatase A